MNFSDPAEKVLQQHHRYFDEDSLYCNLSKEIWKCFYFYFLMFLVIPMAHSLNVSFFKQKKKQTKFEID